MKKTETETALAFEGVLHIAPTKDRQVRKPDGAALPTAGENVNVDADQSYWLRRLNDGDIVAAPAIEQPEDNGDDA